MVLPVHKVLAEKIEGEEMNERIEQERVKFEKYMHRMFNHWDNFRWPDGQYRDYNVHCRWRGWLAALGLEE